MRAVVQRVKGASVAVEGRVKGEIKKGLLVYLGIEKGDGPEDLKYISSKLSGLRIFTDPSGRMNLDIRAAGGQFLIVSQFTLCGDLRKGRRPSFDRAEAPEKAVTLYKRLIENLKREGFIVKEGEFRAHMEIKSVNDGPVTLLLDSKKTF